MALCTQALEHFDEICSPLLPGVPVEIVGQKGSTCFARCACLSHDPKGFLMASITF